MQGGENSRFAISGPRQGQGRGERHGVFGTRTQRERVLGTRTKRARGHADRSPRGRIPHGYSSDEPVYAHVHTSQPRVCTP
jgi:hypothetical protein